MKREVRVLGLDDAPFTFGDARVPVVGVVMRGGHYVEGFLRTDVAVDGEDATERILEAVQGSRHRDGLGLVLLDGVTYGGFNVVDLDRLHAGCGVPVLAVTRGEPDLDAMEAALRKHDARADAKVALLRRHAPQMLRTEGQPLAWRAAGLDAREVAEALALTTVRGLVPEPLRLAHLAATMLVEGHSRGL